MQISSGATLESWKIISVHILRYEQRATMKYFHKHETRCCCQRTSGFSWTQSVPPRVDNYKLFRNSTQTRVSKSCLSEEGQRKCQVFQETQLWHHLDWQFHYSRNYFVSLVLFNEFARFAWERDWKEVPNICNKILFKNFLIKFKNYFFSEFFKACHKAFTKFFCQTKLRIWAHHTTLATNCFCITNQIQFLYLPRMKFRQFNWELGALINNKKHTNSALV